MCLLRFKPVGRDTTMGYLILQFCCSFEVHFEAPVCGCYPQANGRTQSPQIQGYRSTVNTTKIHGAVVSLLVPAIYSLLRPQIQGRNPVICSPELRGPVGPNV